MLEVEDLEQVVLGTSYNGLANFVNSKWPLVAQWSQKPYFGHPRTIPRLILTTEVGT